MSPRLQCDDNTLVPRLDLAKAYFLLDAHPEETACASDVSLKEDSFTSSTTRARSDSGMRTRSSIRSVRERARELVLSPRSRYTAIEAEMAAVRVKEKKAEIHTRRLSKIALQLELSAAERSEAIHRPRSACRSSSLEAPPMALQLAVLDRRLARSLSLRE